METINFQGLECVKLANRQLMLLVTKSVGPRVISLQVEGSQNLFAELPDAKLDFPGEGDFYLYGGHRLWHAPEDPARTYVPDNDPVEVREIRQGIEVTTPVEAATGMQKSIRIELMENSPKVVLTHSLINRGLWPVLTAPWAITQLRGGGVGLLPQSTQEVAGNPTLPNRTLAIWPYVDMGGSYFTWEKDYILVRANMDDGALKIGFPNPRGWLAYWNDGTLFVKRADYSPRAPYYDFGSSSECYCNPQFLELETLGPSITLQPGAKVEHRETWHAYAGIDWPKDPRELIAFIDKDVITEE